MATINVIRHSDGRTYYPCGTSAIPPTNPRAGTPTSGNTIIWNGRTRVTTLVVPRQNPVDVASWSHESQYRTSSVPITYNKPVRHAMPDLSRPATIVSNPTCVIPDILKRAWC